MLVIFWNTNNEVVSILGENKGGNWGAESITIMTITMPISPKLNKYIKESVVSKLKML